MKRLIPLKKWLLIKPALTLIVILLNCNFSLSQSNNKSIILIKLTDGQNISKSFNSPISIVIKQCEKIEYRGDSSFSINYSSLNQIALFPCPVINTSVSSEDQAKTNIALKINPYPNPFNSEINF